MILASLFNDTINAFNVAEVDYLIVGGYAVNFHGYERSTSDLDIWVKPTESNKTKICTALNKLGYEKQSLSKIESYDFTKPFLFRIGSKPLQIEIFNTISGVEYSEAEKNKILFSLPQETPVYFISLKDLIINKMVSGRAIDKLDVEELQKINIHSKDRSILDTLKKLFGQ